MNATTKVYLRTDQQNVNGSNSVYLRLTIKRIPKVFSLNIAVLPKNWNSQINQVKKTDKEYLIKNKYIAKYQSKAQNIIADYFLKDKILTFNKFREEFFNQSSSDTDFYKFVENEMNNRVYAKETLKGYKSVFTKLKDFKKKWFMKIIYAPNILFFFLIFFFLYNCMIINILKSHAKYRKTP